MLVVPTSWDLFGNNDISEFQASLQILVRLLGVNVDALLRNRLFVQPLDLILLLPCPQFIEGEQRGLFSLSIGTSEEKSQLDLVYSSTQSSFSRHAPLQDLQAQTMVIHKEAYFDGLQR